MIRQAKQERQGQAPPPDAERQGGRQKSVRLADSQDFFLNLRFMYCRLTLFNLFSQCSKMFNICTV